MTPTRLACLAMLAAAAFQPPVLAAGAPGAHSANSTNNAMLKLAKASGCMACHHTEPGGQGPDGGAAIGPSWREVAARYKGQAGAQDKLTQTVFAGSNPYQRHWQGQVSGLAMPPNAVAVKPADARKLVRWILAMDPPAGP